jgi:hypothetical protein
MLAALDVALLSVMPELVSLPIIPLSVYEDSAIYASEEEAAPERTLSVLLALAEAPAIAIPDSVADAFTDWSQISGIISDLCPLSSDRLHTVFPGKHPVADVGPGEDIPCDLPVLVFSDISRHCDLSRLDSLTSDPSLPLSQLRAKTRFRPIEPEIPTKMYDIPEEEDEVDYLIPPDVIGAFLASIDLDIVVRDFSLSLSPRS